MTYALKSILYVPKMEFPPDKDLRPRDEFLNHEAEFAMEKPHGLEVTMEFHQLVAGRVQIYMAGTEMLQVHVDAETLLGSKVSGSLIPLPSLPVLNLIMVV